MVSYRSVSQVKQYEKCPYQYYLQRRERAWQRPAAWLPQGTAVHTVAEHWELSGRTMPLSEAEALFRKTYAEDVDKLCEDTPNLEYWFRSGPYDGEKDIARRYEKGLAQVKRYVDYYTVIAPEEKVWRDDNGEPAVEMAFDIDLDGVQVIGKIDQGIIHKELGLIARDVKTGKTPGDEFQLGTYAVAIKLEYDVDVLYGDYWMGEPGKPTKPYDLSEWTLDRVTEVFHEVDEGIRAERFDPKPSTDNCNFCPVSLSCKFASA